jgi:translocation and assembly module TamB
VALLVLAGAGLWWWSGTPGSLDWTLRQVARSQPFTAVGVQGSLREGMKVERLSWEDGGLKVEVFNALLEWQPLALWRGQLRLDRVEAARLRVQDDRPPTPKAPPQAIAPSLRIAVDALKVGRMEWIAAGSAVEVTQVSAAYRFDGDQHRLRLHELRWGGGVYQADAMLGAGGDMPLDATLQGRFEASVPGSTATLPLSATATFKGPITNLRGSARLQGPASATNAAAATASTSATATARITFWSEQPVPEAQASFQRLDLAALWPQAPHTRLQGDVRIQPAGTGTWTLGADLRNELAGPWDAKRLPLQRLQATGEWRAGGQAIVQELLASIGGGELRASGRWLGPQGWKMDGSLANINPAEVHSAMAAVPFGGRAGLAGEGEAVSFDLDLKAQPRNMGARRAAGTTNELSAAVARIELRTAQVRGRWMNGLLSLPMVDLRTADAAVEASLEIRPGSRAGRGQALLTAPGLRARAQGELAPDSGAGSLRLTSTSVASALKWLGKLPAMPAAIKGVNATGRGELRLDWQGGWRDPAVQAEMNLPLLELRQPPAQAAGTASPPWVVRDATATVRGKLSAADIAAKGRAELGQRRVAVELAANGGRQLKPLAWQASMNKLNVSASDPALGTGTWALRLQNAFNLRWSGQSFDAGAGSAALTSPAGGASAGIAWDPVRWQSGQLQTAGRLTGIPLAWIELIGGAQLAGLALSGDMVFDGQWDVALGTSQQRVRASLARASGDISLLAQSADGNPTRVAAGVRRAQLSLNGDGDALTATLDWDSERAGTARGRLATRLSGGSGGTGWDWPASAPLTGELQARLPRISAWSLLAPPGWRLRGSLAADLAVSGTRTDPQLAGTLAADDLALRSVVDGIELQGGQLRARLQGRRLVISEFVLQGVGEGRTGGTLRATGEGSWAEGGLQVSMTAQLDRLRASIRADRELTVSGRLATRHDASGTNLTGELKVDRALIELPEESTPKLGDDVVVRGAAGVPSARQAQAPQPAARPGARPLAAAIELDLGDDFRVRGMGIDTRLRGTVRLSGESLARPRLDGVITAAGGQYRAYGQRLNIERGVIRFTGPPDNPALDILAVRPNMIERVGVMVSGRALAPYVRLYSEPDMPDAEKLSFLVTGRRSPNGGAEAALVQQAATALLASRAGGGKGGIAGALGLDELSFNRQGSTGPSVTLGKRIGQDIYAAYEHGMSGALGTLYIFYDLTRRLTLRLAAGERTAVDLILSFSFDRGR